MIAPYASSFISNVTDVTIPPMNPVAVAVCTPQLSIVTSANDSFSSQSFEDCMKIICTAFHNRETPAVTPIGQLFDDTVKSAENIGKKVHTAIDPVIQIIQLSRQFFSTCSHYTNQIVSALDPFVFLAKVEARSMPPSDSDPFLSPETAQNNYTNTCPKENISMSLLEKEFPEKMLAKPLVCSSYFGYFDDAYNETMKISDQIPWHYTKHRINLAFITVNAEGKVAFGNLDALEKLRSLVATIRKAVPKIEIFGVTNWGWEVDKHYQTAAKYPERFAESALAFLKENDLDGLDIDQEAGQLKDLFKIMKATYDLFQRTNANSFGKKYKLSSVEGERFVDAYDHINLMTYCSSVEKLESYLDRYEKEGIDTKKLIIGISSEVYCETRETVFEKVHRLYKRVGGFYTWRLENDSRDVVEDGSERDKRFNYKRQGPSTFEVAKWLYEATNNCTLTQDGASL